MSLKVKFALLISTIVFVILSLAILIMYLLGEKNQKASFNTELKLESIHTYHSILERSIENVSFDSILKTYPVDFAPVSYIISDGIDKVLFKYPDTLDYHPDYPFLNQIRLNKELYFKSGEASGVGIFIKEGRREHFILATGIDVNGKESLKRLKKLSLLVLFGGSLLAGIVTCLFMQHYVRPLQKLNQQMQGITENNLRERITMVKGANELSQIARNFNDMMARLQKGFEMQKSFVDHASHELRTPLASMLAQTEAAIRKNISDEKEVFDLLNSLREDQQDMIELTNSLLLLSQYEKLSYSEDWPKVRIDEIIYDTISSVQRMLSGINISLEFAELPEDELDLSVHGNESLLRSAFRNLIKNAYLYSPDKTVKIIIEANSKQIQIHFINKGKVLDMEEQERLFIPFFRGKNSQSKKGFGLGLSIVVRIVTLHKSMVKYKALSDTENQFSIVFPKGPQPEEDI